MLFSIVLRGVGQCMSFVVFISISKSRQMSMFQAGLCRWFQAGVVAFCLVKGHLVSFNLAVLCLGSLVDYLDCEFGLSVVF